MPKKSASKKSSESVFIEITKGKNKSPKIKITKKSPKKVVKKSPKKVVKKSPKKVVKKSPKKVVKKLPTNKSPTNKSPTKKSPTKESPKKVVKKSPKIEEIVPIKKNSLLNKRQEKYCSCVIKTSEKQPSDCLINKKWYGKVDGKRCYNPYAICAFSTLGGNKKCGESYDFKNFTVSQLLAYCDTRAIKLTNRSDKSKILEKIYEYKNKE